MLPVYFSVSHVTIDYLFEDIDAIFVSSYKIAHFYFVANQKGFDDMDSIYASPEDFHQMKQRDRIRGLHLLEYFVNQCHQLGVIKLCYC
jgi:hypothetical protein